MYIVNENCAGMLMRGCYVDDIIIRFISARIPLADRTIAIPGPWRPDRGVTMLSVTI